MEQRIGECSICGGSVVAYVGPWMGIHPPPPPHCAGCGAVSAAHDPVIPMRRPKRAIVVKGSPVEVLAAWGVLASQEGRR